ncbi:phosphoribosylglycinamide formyltransferase [Limnobacter parvus]|uniref:Phosphoribosylglycinamide formyltransferase n=1 Tax=Limnobacter parvus TaxID=2939690 RepID=A0ABT1XKH0_9BURK|nr:phosphoribosylglycinamide formyltransferase [Limnobacter parvus]MCR2747788.1 phosphoribosylglycinamide formyltransferase [Limnobacter parvus]
MQNSTPSVVILISGRGSNLNALIDHAKQTGVYQIRAVISNRPSAAGLALAQAAGIDTAILDHTEYDSREAFDAALAGLIEQYQPNWVVLAGFMRVLTEGFVNRYLGRLVNIHPSLLPAFPGLKTHQQALDAGVRVHGVTVHLVTPELDHGPIVDQAMLRVLPGDTPETLAARVLELEHQIYPRALSALASGRIKTVDGRLEGTLTLPLVHAIQ